MDTRDQRTASLHLGTTVGQTERWWSLAKYSFLKQLPNVADLSNFPSEKEGDASGGRKEAGFIRMGGSNEGVGRREDAI